MTQITKDKTVQFSDTEIHEIDQFWRTQSVDHPWTGWAMSPDTPEEVWIFRTRANWRQFILKKEAGKYVLVDDFHQCEASFNSLENLAERVTQVPALKN